MSKIILPRELHTAAPVTNAGFNWAVADKATEPLADYGVSRPVVEPQGHQNILQELAAIAKMLDLMSIPEKASNLERLIALASKDRKE
ncbi:hypothetical protein [uncultured Roseobacter sp.]|uniref:hypothetical protein n=1 Tax=uncultured Roseobacter sp. TaxID=114847 RepID=UPI00262CCC5F|nr:hypothetical protein [uncultured Roseobacter sp.]